MRDNKIVCVGHPTAQALFFLLNLSVISYNTLMFKDILASFLHNWFIIGCLWLYEHNLSDTRKQAYHLAKTKISFYPHRSELPINMQKHKDLTPSLTVSFSQGYWSHSEAEYLVKNNIRGSGINKTSTLCRARHTFCKATAAEAKMAPIITTKEIAATHVAMAEAGAAAFVAKVLLVVPAAANEARE